MRLDISVHDLAEIDAILAFLKQANISRIGVSHTQKGVSSLEVARIIKEQMPNIDIMLYLSTKHFHSGAIADGRSSFRKAFEEAKRIGVNSVLIISGHPRTDFDSIEALREIYEQRSAKGLDVYCAYNPYFDPGRLREEQERLTRKCGFDFVKGVCFQIGMDVGKLQKGVEFVQSIRKDLVLYGAAPVPGSATREWLKTAGLYGVFLPNSYLLDDELAMEMTQDYLAECKKMKLEPLVFSADQEELKKHKALF